MALETYTPGPPLAEYIHMMWAWKGFHPPHPAERILPGGLTEITFNFGDAPFRIYGDEPQAAPLEIRDVLVVGAHSKHFLIDTSQPMSLLSVLFKPGGTLPLLGAGGHKVHNAHLPLDTLWGLAADDLVDQLREAPTTQARFCILENTLTQRLAQAQTPHRAVRYALDKFQRMPYTQTIRTISEEIALSQTRFIQVFREDVGMTPKQFCRVQRFQFALRLIARQRATAWVDVALTSGYYDQAHFNRDFRHFAGITPREYSPQSWEHPTNLPVFELT